MSGQTLARCGVLLACLFALALPAHADAAKKPRPPRPADLRILSVSAPSSVTVGQAVTSSVRVRNLGATTAKASKVRLLLSSDATRSSNDLSLGIVPVRSLKPRASADATLWNVPLPAQAAAGTSWRVIACADDSRVVKESNERNNCTSATTTLTVVAPTPPTPTVPTVTKVPISVTATQVGVEGSTGTSSLRVIRFTISVPSGAGGSVWYRTSSGTATEAVDFDATSGSSKAVTPAAPLTVDVRVRGDLLDEPSETFTLDVYRASGELATGSGTGTIADDDVPAVTTAIAPDATHVELTFDSALDPASILANGSQFTITPSLAVTAASVSGTKLTLTTAQQLGDVDYDVTWPASVHGAYGDTPDDSDAFFVGYGPVAQLVVNELNLRLTDARVELLALTGGSVAGQELRSGQPDGFGYRISDPLPSISVQAGDRIILHSSLSGAVTETASKGECGAAGCVAGAWDVVRVGQGHSIYANDGSTIYLTNAAGTVLDAIAFYSGTITYDPSFLDVIDDFQLMDEWPDTCAAYPCTYAEAMGLSVDWTSMSTSIAGTSMQRTPDGRDTNSKADWVAAASTWGAANS